MKILIKASMASALIAILIFVGCTDATGTDVPKPEDPSIVGTWRYVTTPTTLRTFVDNGDWCVYTEGTTMRDNNSVNVWDRAITGTYKQAADNDGSTMGSITYVENATNRQARYTLSGEGSARTLSLERPTLANNGAVDSVSLGTYTILLDTSSQDDGEQQLDCSNAQENR